MAKVTAKDRLEYSRCI
ncbi:Protein of unknown function [Pyronema omphalodes CBS 100304]|uniref:Uncharacterized protein n=1 Tax=Pyronema omphalodes (strain CBS 100304) TaxID=1076935 RepID=U4LFG8_PYROM|nr:Protein of unknown function [Pyronema omphalodes CBS 100304]